MFNIGFNELLVILVIAFIIVGPSDLPKVARGIAKIYKKVRNMWNEVVEAINLETEIGDMNQTKEEVKQAMKEINPAESVRKEIGDISQTVQSTKKETKELFHK